jgi:hypothetical protein
MGDSNMHRHIGCAHGWGSAREHRMPRYGCQERELKYRQPGIEMDFPRFCRADADEREQQ